MLKGGLLRRLSPRNDSAHENVHYSPIKKKYCINGHCERSAAIPLILQPSTFFSAKPLPPRLSF